jgi:hypothetical protein
MLELYRTTLNKIFHENNMATREILRLKFQFTGKNDCHSGNEHQLCNFYQPAM